MPLLEINDVSVSFGDTEVLSGISLELESKQLLAVLGASGAGKSTLMRLIAGFDSVGGGSIVLDGEILSDSSKTVAPEVLSATKTSSSIPTSPSCLVSCGGGRSRATA